MTITTALELATAITDYKSCLADTIYKASESEKKGDVKQAILYRDNAELIRAFINALGLYDFNYDNNCISLEKVNLINERLEGLCGCGCASSVSDLAGNSNPCDLSLMNFAIATCGSSYYLWALDARGNTNYFDSKTTFEFFESLDNVTYTPCPLLHSINRAVINSASNFFKLIATCGGNETTTVIGKIDSSSYLFQNYLGYRLNTKESSGFLQYLDSADLYVKSTYAVQLVSSDSETICDWKKLPSTTLSTDVNSVIITASQANADYEVAIECKVKDKMNAGCYVKTDVTLHFVPDPIIGGAGNTTVRCAGSTKLLTAYYGSNGVITYGSYQWYLNGVAIGGATSRTYTATVDGKYTVVAIKNGVTVTSVAVVVSTNPNSPQPVIQVDFTSFPAAFLSASLLDAAGETFVTSSGNTGFYIKVVDTGVFATTGYPTGTTFEFVGYTTPDTPNTLLVSSTGYYSCIVTLPPSYGSCAATTTALFISFDSTTAQTTHTCSDGSDDFPLVTKTTLTSSSWSLNALAVSPCGHDYSPGASWFKYYDLDTHTFTTINGATGRPFSNIGTGTSIIITSKGLYGYYSTEMSFGAVLIAVS